MNIQAVPLSLYIHIPWCIKKCPYCDFNSHNVRGEIPQEEYVQALIQDLELNLPENSPKTLTSIFFGGGTPSLFSPKSIEKILQAVAKVFNINHNTEITLEANPGAISLEKFIGFKQAGVNRISLGVQSFNNKMLERLGRIHDSNNAKHAIKDILNAGFNNYNIDLMFGLPQQTKLEAMDDLNQAIDFNPAHVSWYQLTLEPNTLFYKNPPSLPDDDTLVDIYQCGQNILAKAGLNQYEVSAYTKSLPSKHNLNYWQFGDYLGIGAGAHSKITNIENQTITRYHKYRSPKLYLNANTNGGDFIAGSKIIHPKELAFEFMLNAMRLNEGVDVSLLNHRAGLSIADIESKLSKAYQLGLLQQINTRIIPTAKGRMFLNDLIELFLEEE